MKKKSNKEQMQKKRMHINVPTNKQPKLTDLKLMKPHAFLSETKATHTVMKKMVQVDGRQYEVMNDGFSVSTILKLILNIHQTNELSPSWSLILWNISQQAIVPPEVQMTFVRSFERRGNEAIVKAIKRRGITSVLSSEKKENKQVQNKAVRHDENLLNAVGSGDSVVGFCAEVLVSAPDELILEDAISKITDYLNSNDETRGLKYALDINKLARPLITYGSNKYSGNGDIFVEMTSFDAGLSALFVDSGGDRTPGSEYVGVSVGKLIRSHAAYNFQNSRSLYIGNDTQNVTHTIGKQDIPEGSQIYLSKVASRSYLLEGRSVTHIVADHPETAEKLMNNDLYDEHKICVDVSKGLLNMIEPIKTPDMEKYPKRVISRFPNHIDNIIILLTQFRDVGRISVTDTFASITREILINFFIANKYWQDDAENNIDNLRLFGKHNQYKTLKDFGMYVKQQTRINTDKRLENALFELDTIVNKNILPTIPSLDTKTDKSIDTLVSMPYRVIDLTGMSTGAISNINNPSLNVMMISYLNVILPSLKNGDVVIIHGLSKMHKIANTIQDMLESGGIDVDVIYTESNQKMALKTIGSVDNFDFVAVDLYQNKLDNVVDKLHMDSNWVGELSQSKSAFFVKTSTGNDYIYLDNIL